MFRPTTVSEQQENRKTMYLKALIWRIIKKVKEKNTASSISDLLYRKQAKKEKKIGSLINIYGFMSETDENSLTTGPITTHDEWWWFRNALFLARVSCIFSGKHPVSLRFSPTSYASMFRRDLSFLVNMVWEKAVQELGKYFSKLKNWSYVFFFNFHLPVNLFRVLGNVNDAGNGP